MENTAVQNTPLVSVIVPVYNTAVYLRRCLDSLCAQTYRNLQIICIDDGSTDESPDILVEYAARDPRIIVHTQENAGLAAARNTALSLAKGDWITGLDSDDWIELNTYELLLPAMKTDTDIICFDCVPENIQQAERFPYQRVAFSGKQNVSPRLLLDTNCFFVTKLWRKQFIDEHQGHFPTGLQYEDAYFYYTLAPFAKNIHFSPVPLYHYWQRCDSIMHVRSAKGADHLEIIERIFRQYRKQPLPAVFGSIRPSRFELCLIENYTTHALDHTPDELHPQVLRRACEIAGEFNLLLTFPKETTWLTSHGKWATPFIKARRGKLTYCFFGLPVVSFQFKNNTQITRLLGIKLQQKNTQS